MKQFTYLLTLLCVICLTTACVTTGGNGSDKTNGSNDEPKEEPKEKEPESAVKAPTIYKITTQGLDLADRKMSIRIKSVQDSRCPEGTTCVTAGKAKVVFEVTKDRNTTEVTLNAKGLCQGDTGKCGDSAMVDGIKIQMLNVYPAKTNPSKQIEQSAYVAKVRI